MIRSLLLHRRRWLLPPTSSSRSPSPQAIVFDWGDTLMRVFPRYKGPMADWPRVRSMPGTRQALDKLPPHLTCCVATGGQDSDAELLAAALARVRIRHHFRYLFTRHELGGADKPDPAFYRAIAQRLSLRPPQIILVGNDLARDILPAKKIGMRTIWVTPLRIRQRPPEADAVLPTLRGLSTALSRF